MNYEEAIKIAIKATNESLYRWKNSKGLKQFNYTDVHSLLKSCLSKELKHFNYNLPNKRHINKCDTLLGQLYNYGKPLIELDETNLCVINFDNYDNFLAKIIHNLDLKELYYNPVQEAKVTNFTNDLLNINFEEIKQIKF